MHPFGGPGSDVPAVVGHRGAPLAAPENTPASFLAAADAGATWVELDVRRSADGIAVVHHDPVTPDGVPLIERAAQDLAALGVWSLEAVLAVLPPSLGVDLEVKNDPTEPDFDVEHRTVELVGAALDAERSRPAMTSSFNPLTVAALAQALPRVPAGLLHTSAASMTPAQTTEIAVEYEARVLCPQAGTPALDHAGVAAVHEAGLSVMVWTVDDGHEARCLREAGVDAICTNDPATVSDALRA